MKRAVIMGATSGIGNEVSRILAARGWKVGIAGRREDILKSMCEEAPGSFVYEVIDVTDPAAPECLERLIGKLGGMDLYLHSSGYGRMNPGPDEQLDAVTVRTNVTGFVLLVNRAFRYFRERQHGHIAAITSVAGTRGLGLNASYSASKRFQMTYLGGLAQLSNNNKYNIVFTDIRPGFVKTPFLHMSSYPMLMESAYASRIMVKGLLKGKRVVIIDWRYRILILVWHLIPRALWERINLQRFIRK